LTGKQQILIIEDETSLLHALAEQFQQAQFTVVTAVDGEVAWQLIQKQHPDFVVLDILMPKMNGFNLLNRIRQTPWGRDLPVMLLSNISDEPRANEIAKTDPYCTYFTKSNLTIEDVISKAKQSLLSIDT
jgi:CheY-like chemotaxis protein